MSLRGVLLDQDQFCCSVCPELLKEPVAIPCGHSYCRSCVEGYWDQDDQGIYSCPQCKQTFTPRPNMRKNNMLAEVLETLQKTGLQPTRERERERGHSPIHYGEQSGWATCIDREGIN
uniref:RING-type domain-containing protein n=1 Tax=Oncorhynchus mykiss TaxID=8022 RepID=A0A8C7LLZ1_ONCMY